MPIVTVPFSLTPRKVHLRIVAAWLMAGLTCMACVGLAPPANAQNINLRGTATSPTPVEPPPLAPDAETEPFAAPIVEEAALPPAPPTVIPAPAPRLVLAEPAAMISGRELQTSRENLRQSAEGSRTATQEQAPFAPIGVHIGSFILRPSMDQGLRATSNGDNSAEGTSAILSETTLRLNAQSDWSRHQLNLDAAGTITKSLSGQDVSEPRLDLDAQLRLDLGEQSTMTIGAGYLLRRESASSQNAIIGALQRPIVHNMSGSAAIERDLGLLFARITASAEHDSYGDAKLTAGGTVSQKDRDNTYASLTLRSGFQLSPALKPFAELELGKRIFDQTHDHNGFARGGTQLGLRGGVMLDLGEKLNGEASLGFLRASIDDNRLDNVSGLSINAALNWSPQRGTDVRLGAQTIVESATAAGNSGALLYLANLDITHQIRSDLSINTRFNTLIRDNYDGSGTDYTLGLQIGATYWISRFVGLDASLRHEFLKSALATREYNANSIYLGVKFQR